MSKNSEIEVGLAQLQVVQPFYSFLSSHLEDCVSKNFDDSTKSKLTLMDAVRGTKWFNRSGASNSMLVVIFNVGCNF